MDHQRGLTRSLDSAAVLVVLAAWSVQMARLAVAAAMPEAAVRSYLQDFKVIQAAQDLQVHRAQVVAVVVLVLSAAMQRRQQSAVQVEQDQQIQSPAHRSLAQAVVVVHQTVAHRAQAAQAAAVQAWH
jgi:hypothetical protein